MATVTDLIRSVSYTITSLGELQRICIDTENEFLKAQIYLFINNIQEEVEGYLKDVKDIEKD